MAGEKIVGAALNKVRQLNPLGLFSKGAEEAAALKQAKGTPEQMRAMLLKQGVKPAELENAGFNAAFAGRPSVTKDEIAQFLQDRAPKIDEKVLGATEQKMPKEIKEKINAAGAAYDWPEFDRLYGEWNSSQNYGGKPKFQQYTLPGGENYREVQLKLDTNPPPISENSYYDLADKMSRGPLTPEEAAQFKSFEAWKNGTVFTESSPYYSDHWDDADILAHLRMSDRLDPEGRKLLHVEEIQSDWGQEGRKLGFNTPERVQKVAALQAEERRLQNYYNDLRQQKTQLQPTSGGVGEPMEYPEGYNESIARLTQAMRDTQSEISAIRQSMPGQGVPTAPYVTSTPGWTDLALKRALREAAEGDYHAMAWTPGAEQAARYPGGGDKMAAGLTAYYNKIVPTQLQKMTRDLDPNAQLGTTAINDVQAPSLTITPEMREKIKQGLPLFAAPVAATLGAEEQPTGFARGGYAEGGPAMDDNQLLALLKSLYAGGAQLRDPSGGATLDRGAFSDPTGGARLDRSYDVTRGLPRFDMRAPFVDYTGGAKIDRTPFPDQTGGARLDRSRSFAPAPFPEGGPQFDMRAPYRSTTQMPGSVPALQAREFAPTNVDEALRRVRQMEPQREVPLPPRRPASLDRRPEPVREPVREPEVNASRSLWDRYNETGSAADFIAASNAMREGHAEGGHVLSDDYPTHYMPHVGRQVMAGGGEAEAQRALDLANDIRSYERQMRDINAQPEEYRQMTHAPERPRAPIQVEGGFIGKRTLGSAPYDVAGPLAGAAQAAYDMKTLPLYFTPAAPYAMAADIGEGMAAGSPSQVAMSALGPMGKAGRTVAGMATGATAALSPDEARAEGAYRPILDDRLIDILRRYASGGSVSHRALMVSSKDT